MPEILKTLSELDVKVFSISKKDIGNNIDVNGYVINFENEWGEYGKWWKKIF